MSCYVHLMKFKFMLQKPPKRDLHEEEDRVVQPRMTCRQVHVLSELSVTTPRRQVVFGYVSLSSSHVSTFLRVNYWIMNEALPLIRGKIVQLCKIFIWRGK